MRTILTIFNAISLPFKKYFFALFLLLTLVAFQQVPSSIPTLKEAITITGFYKITDSLLQKRDFWEANQIVEKTIYEAKKEGNKALEAACLLTSGKIYKATNQLSFTKAIQDYQQAIQNFQLEDTVVWQLAQSRLGLAESLFKQYDSQMSTTIVSNEGQVGRLKIDSLLQAVIDALGKAHPMQIDALFLKGMNQVHLLKTEEARATLQPIKALQRRYPNYKKEYDYLLESNISLSKNKVKEAALYLEKAAVLLDNQPASDFGKQQLCHSYLRLSDVFAERDSMLLATECTQRVLIAMSTGFKEPENLLPSPEFRQLQHLPLCIDALLRKAKYIKPLDKTGFAAYNCTHLAAQSCTHLQNQIGGKQSLLAFKFRMMHAFNNAFKESYDLYKSSEDTTFISDALYLIDREKALQFWLINRLATPNNAFRNMEQRYAALSWWYAKEAMAAKENGDISAHLLFERQKNQINILRETLLETSLEKEQPYLALKYAPNIPSLQSIQETLGPEELLLQYFNGTDSSYLISLSFDKVEFHCLSSRDDMSKLTKTFDKLVSSAENLKDFQIKAKQLSALLLPLEISSFKRIIIIPDFGLYHIPFEVLSLNSDKDYSNFKTGSYLFNNHSISYQYSLLSYWQWKQKKIAPVSYRILAFALASNEHAHVQSELDYLNKRFSATVLKDSVATQEALFSQANQYGFLHFSGALLLDPSKIDGLQLRTAQVLLNNTQTTIFENDYAALGFSFIQAGSASVISSLWHSESEESTKLLELYYERIQQGLSKDEALRQARITYLEEMSEEQCLPRFWAQYQVYGDYRNVAISEPISYIWWYLLPIVGLLVVGWWAMRGLRQRKRF